MELVALFVASLLAATLIPAQSEAVLAGLYLQGEHSGVLLVLVATVGNVLGACINWLLGRYARQFQQRRWFPISPKALEKASHYYARFGVWTLLLAWVPFIGDPLTVVAGILRTRFWLFVTLVTLGKAGRYIALVAALS